MYPRGLNSASWDPAVIAESGGLSRSALISQRGVLMIQSLDVIRRLDYVVQFFIGGERRAA
jgi:hypothetical protein